MDLTAADLARLVGSLGAARPPLYEALAGRLRLLVSDGRVSVGARLPTERELAGALHCSRATVTSAYGRLREDGWAVARQGSGTWTRLPAGPDLGAWLPAPDEPGMIGLSHAALAAPPQVSAAFTAALADLPRLLPGHGYAPGGLLELRARIAARFTDRGLPTTPEQVLVTGGALHAAALALSVLARPGDGVLVESPSYPSTLDVAVAQGAVLVPVPVSADSPDDVAGALHRAARRSRPTAAYLMPDFSNPTGLLLDEAQRRRLAVGLEQCGVVTVVDETLVELALDGAVMPPPLAALTRPGLAVTVGSMSKTVWGGLRIGWLRADVDVVQRCSRALSASQLALPVLEQLAACHLLDATDELLPVRRNALRSQRDALASALAAQLPDWRVRVPAGGLVLWCELPAGLSSSAVAAAAGPHGLHLTAGPRFGVGGEDRLRLPFTHPTHVLEEAVTRLVGLVEGVSGTPSRAHSEEELLVV